MLGSCSRVTTVCFASLCAIGLLGAFVGLNASGLWGDELFSSWMVDGSSFSEQLRRMFTDVHPPLYYLLLVGWTRLAGTSDAAYRLLSAFCACGAILVFIRGTRGYLSLTARMFAGALAVASPY